jgi:DNA-binding transcriptional regulator GbsR (MarR family)
MGQIGGIMTADKKTIIRRITDYLHKYGTDSQVLQVAALLNISTAPKVDRPEN